MTQNPLLDLRNLVFLIWKHLHLPDPTPLQYDICNYLQYGPKRLVLQAFRGCGKSYLTAAFVLQQLVKDPSVNILVVSASQVRATQFTQFTLGLIKEMPELAYLRPRQDQRESMLEFCVGPSGLSQSASVRACGITGQLTGSRADLIIADDVEVANNSYTQGMRDRLGEAVKEFDSILKPGASRVVFLGTPQTEYSIYKSLEDRGYTLRIYPARVPDGGLCNQYGDRLAPSVRALAEDPARVGSPVEPRRFTTADLLEREQAIGRSTFALQFMLNPCLSDLSRYPLKLSDLIVTDVDEETAYEGLNWSSDSRYALGADVPNVGLHGDRFYTYESTKGTRLPYAGSVMAIDPSGRGEDSTGYAVIKMLNGHLYLIDGGSLPGGHDDATLEQLAKIAAKHAVKEVLVESNFGDGMYTRILMPILQKHAKAGIREVRHSKQKELRIIDTLEPVMNRHRLIVNKRIIAEDYNQCLGKGDNGLQYSLFYQLSRITRERGSLRHDDALDALAMAVTHWTDAMAVNDEKRISEREWREMERSIRANQVFSSRTTNDPKLPIGFWHN